MFNIPNLDKLTGLGKSISDDLEFDDANLENELEEILSGKKSLKKTQIIDNSKPNLRTQKKVNQNLNISKTSTALKLNFDLNHLESLGLDLNLNDDIDSEIDNDEDDPELNSQLEAILNKNNSSKQINSRQIEQNVLLTANKKVKSEILPRTEATEESNTTTHILKNSDFFNSEQNNISEKELEINEQKSNILNKNTLIKWKDEYKSLALKAKKEDDKKNALVYFKTFKDIDSIINALDKGESIDLSTINIIAPPNEAASQESSDSTFHTDIPEVTEEEAKKIFNAPPAPKTILEGLEQRLCKYKETLKEAQNENNPGKVKRLSRLIKSFESAIKANKSGKPFDYESLPKPPGFADFPTIDAASNKQQKTDTNVSTDKETSKLNKTVNEKKNLNDDQKEKNNSSEIRVKPPFKKSLSISDKQITYLLERQNLFKKAAIESKKNGDITQALEYLKKSKGFEPLIEATKMGLPIDASSIPLPPQLKDDFVIISNTEENVDMNNERGELFKKLEADLIRQIELCNRNKDHFFKLGDVATGSKFEKYLLDMSKELDMLKNYHKLNQEVPKFHYENRVFSIVVSNTDLSNSELMFEILQGIDLPLKNPIDSYIKIEFPFPKDEPQLAKTFTFKNSLNPKYNQTFKFNIDRKSRVLARIFKKTMKCELYSKGGFFKSDSLVSQVNIRLSDLESKCTIFDSFPFMNGRKEIGGKLQVRIRIREPLLSKQVEEIREKWLVFN